MDIAGAEAAPLGHGLFFLSRCTPFCRPSGEMPAAHLKHGDSDILGSLDGGIIGSNVKLLLKHILRLLGIVTVGVKDLCNP